jgi:hypothetical protein
MLCLTAETSPPGFVAPDVEMVPKDADGAEADNEAIPEAHVSGHVPSDDNGSSTALITAAKMKSNPVYISDPNISKPRTSPVHSSKPEFAPITPGTDTSPTWEFITSVTLTNSCCI